MEKKRKEKILISAIREINKNAQTHFNHGETTQLQRLIKIETGLIEILINKRFTYRKMVGDVIWLIDQTKTDREFIEYLKEEKRTLK